MMIGIYGGTFDPVHYGHLRTALEVKTALRLDEMRLMPCRVPPHRAQPEASPQLRLQMLELALADAGGGFTVDKRELEREGPSYMVDSLRSLRSELGDASICLAVGLDAFYGLPQWHLWRELFDLAHVVVMRRPDSPEPRFDGDLLETMQLRLVDSERRLQQLPAGCIRFVEVTQLAISSSMIRHLLRQGKSPRYLLPDSVLNLLMAQGIYLSPGVAG